MCFVPLRHPAVSAVHLTAIISTVCFRHAAFGGEVVAFPTAAIILEAEDFRFASSRTQSGLHIPLCRQSHGEIKHPLTSQNLKEHLFLSFDSPCSEAFPILAALEGLALDACFTAPALPAKFSNSKSAPATMSEKDGLLFLRGGDELPCSFGPFKDWRCCCSCR